MGLMEPEVSEAARDRIREPAGEARHRTLRAATIGGLSLAALAATGLIAWLIYQRATFTAAGFDQHRAAQSFLTRGLRIITLHPHFHAAVTAATVAVVIAAILVFAMTRRKRWAYLGTTLGCALAIVPLWVVRGEVWDLEAGTASARWAARSPYVAAATNLTIAGTVVLGALAALALATLVTAPRASRSPANGAADRAA